MKVIMPQIGMTMINGTIEKWAFEDGDIVNKGDMLLEITTEKLVNEIEAPATGTLRIIAQEGDIVECGTVIGEIEE